MDQVVCSPLGVFARDLSDTDVRAISDLFVQGGIGQHLNVADVVALIRDEHGDIVAAMTSVADEWSIAVHPSRQGEGLARRMVEVAIEMGHTGYMVAGTAQGLYFLHSLYYHLSEDQKDALDVPCWEELRMMYSA